MTNLVITIDAQALASWLDHLAETADPTLGSTAIDPAWLDDPQLRASAGLVAWQGLTTAEKVSISQETFKKIMDRAVARIRTQLGEWALQRGPGNGPHLAAAPRTADVGSAVGAKALWALWQAHPETIQTRARSWAWAALTPTEKGKLEHTFGSGEYCQVSDRMADAAIAGVADLIAMWAGSMAGEAMPVEESRGEDEAHSCACLGNDGCGQGICVEGKPDPQRAWRDSNGLIWTETGLASRRKLHLAGWLDGIDLIDPQTGEDHRTKMVELLARRKSLTDDDVSWLRLALDHTILNDETARFARSADGNRTWVRTEDAARIAATWIKDSLCMGADVCDPGTCQPQPVSVPEAVEKAAAEIRAQHRLRTDCPSCGRIGGHDPNCLAANGCICGRMEGEPGFGLLCPVHGDPISRKNLTGAPTDLSEEYRRLRQEIADELVDAQAPRIRRGGMQFTVPEDFSAEWQRQEEFKWRLAEIEHQRWADWQRWMHAQCQRNDGGWLEIPPRLVARWERQIITPFQALSDAEKISDLKQVDRYWPLVQQEVQRQARWLIDDAIRRGELVRYSGEAQERAEQGEDSWETIRNLAGVPGALPSKQCPQRVNHDAHAWIDATWNAYYCSAVGSQVEADDEHRSDWWVSDE